jgi:membrane protein DedA with SNARE-associated domain
MAHLPHVIQPIAPYLDRYGYLAVFGGVLLEDFGVPVPGETLMIAGAAVAGLTGHLFVGWVMLLAFFGAVIGDNIGFAIGYFGGRTLLRRYGRYVLIREKQLEKAEHFFDRHGAKVVVVARFIEGLRQLNGILAGASEMRWRKFLLYNAIGAALWVGVWGSVGYFFGNHLDQILPLVERYTLYVIAAALVVLAAVASYALYSRRKRDAG